MNTNHYHSNNKTNLPTVHNHFKSSSVDDNHDDGSLITERAQKIIQSIADGLAVSLTLCLAIALSSVAIFLVTKGIQFLMSNL